MGWGGVGWGGVEWGGVGWGWGRPVLEVRERRCRITPRCQEALLQKSRLPKSTHAPLPGFSHYFTHLFNYLNVMLFFSFFFFLFLFGYAFRMQKWARVQICTTAGPQQQQ